jgi:transposase
MPGWFPPIRVVDTKLADRDDRLAAGVRQIDAAGRRWYTRAFKQEVIAKCQRPGASVSRVAVDHGLNPNLVRKWLTQSALDGRSSDHPALLPVVPIIEPGEPCAEATRFVIEVQLSGGVVLISEHARADLVRAVVQALR